MKPTEQQLDQFVRQNVSLCVSSLVATLASGIGHVSARTRDYPHEGLIEQAAELHYPVEDYEEAARQEGWTETAEGWCWREPTEDDTDADFYFLGSGPFIRAESIQAACELDGLDPYQWEIYEHWAISEWLAEKLEAKGERIDRDFAGLCVWGRTCTGQSISMDGVIVEICAEALS